VDPNQENITKSGERFEKCGVEVLGLQASHKRLGHECAGFTRIGACVEKVFKRPWVWGILVYCGVTLSATKMVSGGRGSEIEFIIERKWLVSLMWEGRAWTNGCKWWSRKAEILSVEEPVVETMGLPVLPCLWLMGSR